MLKLVHPSSVYENSFLEALKEYQAEGRYMDEDIENLQTHFEEYCQKVNGYAQGLNLPEGYVPETYFWLVDNEEFIGNIRVRHYLNEVLEDIGGHIGYDISPSERKMGYGTKMLALALPEAKKLGIDPALITCDETNTGSKKIIEANGGQLDSVSEGEEGKPRKLRFWVPTTLRD